MNNYKNIVVMTMAFICLFFVITFTNPYKLPLILLIVPFLLFGLGSYLVTVELLRLINISAGRRKIIAILLTSVLMLIAILQSIRQLTIRDILILVVLLLSITFYIRRFNITRNRS